MDGRKQKKLKLLFETVNGEDRIATEDGNDRLEQRTWSDLPLALLELIMSRLNLKDNVRASSVCKMWHEAAVPVRVVNQSPWLMYFPKHGKLYEFYDPSERKTYCIDLPELHGSRVCCTKDGWLLLYREMNRQVFFFNPFTREMVMLPNFVLSSQMVAFSCAPTSTSCVVFTIKHVHPLVVAISTCHPGASKWATVKHPNWLPFVSSIWNKPVFCGGVFCCLSITGRLGIYDPNRQTWYIIDMHPPGCPATFFDKNWSKGKFMAEHNGDILIIHTSSTENPIIYKLDRSEMIWEEVQNLDGVTLFAGFLSSLSGEDLPGTMRNSVYFPKVRFFGKRCITYSLDDCRYYPRKQFYDWGEEDPLENIWIQPPQDASSFI